MRKSVAKSGPAPDDRLLELLDGWEGSRIAVRIITGVPEQLLAVFSGRLGRRSDEKHPAIFWPLEVEADFPPAERPGIYLHPETFDGGRVHPGNFVAEIRHGLTTTNVRRLD